LHRENYKLELRARDNFLKKVPTYSLAELQRFLLKTDRKGRLKIRRWIRTGRIVSVAHHGHLRIPKFQFEANGRRLRIIPPILRILNTKFSGWSIAHWFLSPNGWLDGDRPIDELNDDAELLLDAAEQAVAEY
jgi:hypothetical protein